MSIHCTPFTCWELLFHPSIKICHLSCAPKSSKNITRKLNGLEKMTCSDSQKVRLNHGLKFER